MAVSLSEAWNIFEDFTDTDVKYEQKHSTSAKISSNSTSEEKAKPYNQEKHDKEQLMYLEVMVNHLQDLRKEESRRSTIYIALAAILFAVLLAYIDKLSCKIKSLSSNFHQFHRMYANKHELKSMSSDSFPWYA